MYKKHKEIPEVYTVERLAKDYRIMRQRVHAILWLKELEEEEEKKLGRPLDDYVELLLDTCPEFFNSHDREFHVVSLTYKPDFKVMPEGWDSTTGDLDEVHCEISKKENEMLYQEFVQRMNFNKMKLRLKQWFPPQRAGLLSSMYLFWSRLEEDVLPHIQALPNLETLELTNAYVGEKLCFSRGFIKLKHLLLCSFPVLNSIAIEKGAMPNLELLAIAYCLELKALPQGIEFLANVECLALSSVPMQLIESIRGCMDHPKVQHIPEIHLCYERENMMCHESFSGIHSRRRIKPQKHL